MRLSVSELNTPVSFYKRSVVKTSLGIAQQTMELFLKAKCMVKYGAARVKNNEGVEDVIYKPKILTYNYGSVTDDMQCMLMGRMYDIISVERDVRNRTMILRIESVKE